MKSRVFTSVNGLELIVKSRKSAVIFEMNPSQMNNKHVVAYEFADKEFMELIQYIEDVSNESWSGLVPKEANSHESDYAEYYDKELDNNGYLSIQKNRLRLDRPFLESNRLYQFNKRTMASFLYDVKKIVVPA